MMFAGGRRAKGRMITWLMARDGSDCTICHQPLDRKRTDRNDPLAISFDHILPRSAGGTDAVANLRLAHRACNMQRGSDPITEETTT